MEAWRCMEVRFKTAVGMISKAKRPQNTRTSSTKMATALDVVCIYAYSPNSLSVGVLAVSIRGRWLVPLIRREVSGSTFVCQRGKRRGSPSNFLAETLGNATFIRKTRCFRHIVLYRRPPGLENR